MRARPANWHLSMRHRMKKIGRVMRYKPANKQSGKKLMLLCRIKELIQLQQLKKRHAQAAQQGLILAQKSDKNSQKSLHKKFGQIFFACNIVAGLRKTSIPANRLISEAVPYDRAQNPADAFKPDTLQNAESEHAHSNLIAFDSASRRLATSDNSSLTAENMVIIAQLRGWGEISTSGHEVFRKAVWFAGAARGMLVRGFVPTEQDKIELAQRVSVSERALIRQSYRPQGDAEIMVDNPIAIVARQIRDNAMKSLAISDTAANETNAARF